MVRHEPEIRRAKAKLYVESCNSLVHEAPWTTCRTKGPEAGGHEAHGLPYEPGLSNMKDYDPRRFTWVCDDNADNFVKGFDDETGKLASWRWF